MLKDPGVSYIGKVGTKGNFKHLFTWSETCFRTVLHHALTYVTVHMETQSVCKRRDGATGLRSFANGLTFQAVGLGRFLYVWML